MLVSFLAREAKAVKCNSRFYCVTPEVKYISMEEINNTYLNATPIRIYNSTTVQGCQEFCINESRCQAINLHSNDSKEYMCALLDANIFSNSSLLLSNPGYIHLYIPVSLSHFPDINYAVWFQEAGIPEMVTHYFLFQSDNIASKESTVLN